MVDFDVAIIGAGISGLAARLQLTSQSRTTCVLEKSRGLGGRVASRRSDEWTADLGAQFMTPLHPSWPPSVRGSDLRPVTIASDAVHPRYCHPGGMSRLARALAPDTTNIRFGTRVTRLQQLNAGWRIDCDDGTTLSSRAVIATAPVPQTLELMSASHLALPAAVSESLAALTYRSSLAIVMTTTEQAVASWPTIWKDPSDKLDGIYDQTRKGIRGNMQVIVAHTAAAWTSQLWQEEPESVKAAVHEAVVRALAAKNDRRTWCVDHLHKWRYSEPLKIHPERCLVALREPQLVLAGDAFGRSSVDGAFSSGTAAADVVLD